MFSTIHSYQSKTVVANHLDPWAPIKTWKCMVIGLPKITSISKLKQKCP